MHGDVVDQNNFKEAFIRIATIYHTELHWDIDNTETCVMTSLDNLNFTLALGSTSPTHLYFFVALDISFPTKD